MAEKKLAVVITGDAKGAQKAFGATEKSADGMQSKLKTVGAGISTAFKGAAVGGAALGVGLVKFGGDLLRSGAEVEGWRQKAATVFEGQATDVRKWADKNNEALGLTDDQLVGLAASFGDLLKPMGFTAGQAADMSTKVVGLAGALSSWSGGQTSSAEAADILAKAMLGERDGLKSLGIAISEADVQARLAAKGQDKLTGSALEQAKAVATQELIFEKSTDAQKAWAAGGNKSLVAGNKLSAMFAELKETLATKLAPIIATVASWLADKLPVAGQRLREMWDGMRPSLDGVANAFGAVVSALRPTFEAIAKFVGANPAPVIAVVATAVAGLAIATTALAIAENAALIPVYLVLAAIGLLVGAFVLAYQKVDWFRTAVDAVAGFIKGVVVGQIQALRDGFSILAAKASDLWHWFEDKILPTLRTVATVVGQLVVQAFGLGRDAVGWLVAKGSELWTWFDTKVMPTLTAVAGVVTGAFSTAFATGRDAVGWVVTKASDLWRWFDTKVVPILGTVAGVLKGSFSTALDVARGAIGTVSGAVESLWRWLKKAIDRVGDLIGKLSGIPGVGVVGDVLGAIPGFAAGGRPPVGRLAVVGERGPELFVPDRPGTVVPAATTAALIGGRGGQTVYQVDMRGSTFQDGTDAGERIVDAINRFAQGQNRPVLAPGVVAS